MKTNIEFLNDQIDSNETWKRDHVRAMQCQDLSDTIKLGMSLFGLFRSTDDLWSRQVQQGKVRFEPEFPRSILRAYEWWISPCDDILESVNRLERDGHKVDGADELRDACVTVRKMLRLNGSEVIEKLTEVRSAT